MPDEYGAGPRLVVLLPKFSYSRGSDNMAVRGAEEILRQRGNQPRQKQNRLIFFAPDSDVTGRLTDQARTYLAWKSILDDFQSDRLVYQSNQLAEVKRAVESAEQMLQQLVRQVYKWLICPVEEFVRGRPTLQWEAISVSPTAQNLVQEIEVKLHEEEWLISEWSPVHLRNLLSQWYFKDSTTEVNALKVYQDCCHYLYLPRLRNDQVPKDAINKGLETEDFFGFARSKEDGRYLGFVFGRNTMVTLDELALLIEREAAAAYKERIEPAPQPGPGTPGTEVRPNGTPSPGGVTPPQPGGGTMPGSAPNPPAQKQFYGNINLDPVQAKMDFAAIVDEVVQQFTSRLGVEVSISVEIQANSREGFDETLQRTIKENCNVLRFSNAEFEAGSDSY